MFLPAVALLAAVAAAPLEIRYAVLLADAVAGSQVLKVDGPDLRVSYELNDRGRGPKLESRLRIAADGTLAQVSTDGVEYLKAPVSERFTREGKKARWKNRGEGGEAAPKGPAQYLSFDATPVELGLLASALARNDGELDLLPAGHASLQKLASVSCKGAEDSRTAVLHEVTGIDFTPSPVWLEADGTFFAQVSSWSSVVRKGFEPCRADLMAAQDAAAARWYQELARPVMRRPEVLVIEHARLFDAESATLRPDTAVRIEGGLVTAVGPSAEVSRPDDAEIIDAAGKVLLPGLWDMHTHVDDPSGPLFLAAGVTTVRDLGNDVDTIAHLRQAWDEGSQLGPRIIPAGIIDGPGPLAGPTKVLVSTLTEALAAVDHYADLGYPQIKIYSSVDPSLVAPMTARAHERGLRVSGHVPAFMTATSAIQAGFDEINHINMVFLGFWFDTVKDTRSMARLTAVGEKAASLDLASQPVTDFIDLALENHTVIDPTVAIFEELLTARPGQMSPAFAAVGDRLPALVRRGKLAAGLPVTGKNDKTYRDSFRALLKMIALLHAKGVTLVAGTDDMPGFALQRELELYVEAGIPAPEVLRMATLGAARVMSRDGELGSVAPGKRADLVLVDGNPVERISDLRRPVLVVQSGRVVDVPALLQALGIRGP